MDFDLPEDLRMLKKTVADFVDRELIPIEHKTMDGPRMHPDMRAQLERKAKDLGLWLLEVPVEYGGQGSACSAWPWCGRSSRAPSLCRRADR